MGSHRVNTKAGNFTQKYYALMGVSLCSADTTLSIESYIECKTIPMNKHFIY